MESLSAYIPEDRRIALARAMELPEHAVGAALFADVSGFTPLTEALVESLGPQRGAEELSRWLNLIYDVLIAEIERYRGSVITFSGDAITCWFDDQRPLTDDLQSSISLAESNSDRAALRATACALAMQQAMQQFNEVDVPNSETVSLAIKIAVGAGPVRRFIVGDPKIQLIDVMAGKTLDRLVMGEHHTLKGEIVLDEPAAAALGDEVSILTWREDLETGARFAVVDKLNVVVSPNPRLPMPGDVISIDQIRPWLLPPVYHRLESGMGDYLTELRPTIALFLQFGGLDYDGDPQAQVKLNSYVQTVQRVLARYDSYLLNLTIGDKGSYFYASFGAPVAHEDDAFRAILAALDLRGLRIEYITDVKIGVSQGRTRTGSYGGTNRRTYSALGDDVNLAARLMQNAPVGEALITSRVRKASADAFVWEELAPLRVKGKSQPITVLRLIAEQKRRITHLYESKYALPMVGREAELALIEEKFNAASAGHGHIVGITAEIGMGKTRLMVEVIRIARRRNILGYSGECQSYGTTTGYLVWQNIWRGFFGLDPAWSLAEQIQKLEHELSQINPALLPRLPLLGAVLNLQIPDNELTATFSAKLRKESLEALLVDCLRTRARQMPLLLVLEDCQWIDPLSHDLLDVIGRAVADLPVLLAFAYRPPELRRWVTLGVRQLTHFTEIVLTNLQTEEVGQLVALKLAQIYGEKIEVLPALIERISARAEGNPFYIEELINYLHDRGINPQQPDALQQVNLPTSLYSLVLGRIDQLSENQRTLLKVASVIGRFFHVAMLWGISNQVGDEGQVRHDLDILSKLELTILDTPEPELAYLFKHVLTQEIAYETLPFATRAMLHEQIGQYIEKTYQTVLTQYVYLLAHHFDHSENTEKKCEYLLRAGEQAQANYANRDAVSYYERLLPLITEEERLDVFLKLGQVLELEGNWPAADEQYRHALKLAEQYQDNQKQGLALFAVAEILRKQSRYPEAAMWYEKALVAFEQIQDRGGIAKLLTSFGTLGAQQGKYDEAQRFYGSALEIRRTLKQRADIGNILNNLSLVAQLKGDLAGARTLQEESLNIRRELGNKWYIANSLNNIGFIALDQGELSEARSRLEEALALQREIGDKWATANSLNNLGNAVRDQGDYQTSYKFYEESLLLNKELGDQRALAYVLEDIGGLISMRGDQPERALRIVAGAAAIRKSIGAPLSSAEQTKLDRLLAPARQALAEDIAAEAWNAGLSSTLEQAVTLALSSK
ncbi:MAG TPA: tetratricopeptide repeat protein [Anaerolineales bacterium]|nr:tetratricopeptide repeat protein [Anaerolineales bacterium]